MDQDLAEMRLDDVSPEDLTPLHEKPDAVPVPHLLVPHLIETAILLDIDGTLLDLMPTPREVWVPPGLSRDAERPGRREPPARWRLSAAARSTTST